jgi:hypothetical protein
MLHVLQLVTVGSELSFTESVTAAPLPQLAVSQQRLAVGIPAWATLTNGYV